ncbi:putative zinc-binding dehydrogenase family [Rosellinia necatrix]|uniref:Putative zinc-binding dehydrogenase family n=1 Tax=Rosellinia necatrix TaxID=77044 RepID=A0A1W2TQV1_ROSNE|nr:putative zinc-binding dehydrogenase family [Rosellinia necatrix]
MERPLALMLLQTACFVTAWVAVGRRAASRGPIVGARALDRVRGGVYSAASTALLLYLILPPSAAHDVDGGDARRFYHLSKLWAYADVLTARAAGGAVGLHAGFRCLAMPYLTFFRVLWGGGGGSVVPGDDRWRTFAALDVAHCVLEYAYAAGAGIGATSPLVDTLGLAPPAAGLWVEAQAVLSGQRRAGEVLGTHALAAGLFGALLVLRLREMSMRVEMREEGRKVKARRIRYWSVTCEI